MYLYVCFVAIHLQVCRSKEAFRESLARQVDMPTLLAFRAGLADPLMATYEILSVPLVLLGLMLKGVVADDCGDEAFVLRNR